jgi:hypothetical protein
MTEYKEGQRIRATREDAVIEGVLTRKGYDYGNLRLGIREVGWSLEALLDSQEGWTVEVVPPALPTKLYAIIRDGYGNYYAHIDPGPQYGDWTTFKSGHFDYVTSSEGEMPTEFEVIFEGVE